MDQINAYAGALCCRDCAEQGDDEAALAGTVRAGGTEADDRSEATVGDPLLYPGPGFRAGRVVAVDQRPQQARVGRRDLCRHRPRRLARSQHDLHDDRLVGAQPGGYGREQCAGGGLVRVGAQREFGWPEAQVADLLHRRSRRLGALCRGGEHAAGDQVAQKLAQPMHVDRTAAEQVADTSRIGPQLQNDAGCRAVSGQPAEEARHGLRLERTRKMQPGEHQLRRVSHGPCP
jgi:hypothetical protein